MTKWKKIVMEEKHSMKHGKSHLHSTYLVIMRNAVLSITHLATLFRTWETTEANGFRYKWFTLSWLLKIKKINLPLKTAAAINEKLENIWTTSVTFNIPFHFVAIFVFFRTTVSLFLAPQWEHCPTTPETSSSSS